MPKKDEQLDLPLMLDLENKKLKEENIYLNMELDRSHFGNIRYLEEEIRSLRKEIDKLCEIISKHEALSDRKIYYSPK